MTLPTTQISILHERCMHGCRAGLLEDPCGNSTRWRKLVGLFVCEWAFQCSSLPPLRRRRLEESSISTQGIKNLHNLLDNSGGIEIRSQTAKDEPGTQIEFANSINKPTPSYDHSISNSPPHHPPPGYFNKAQIRYCNRTS